MRFRILLLNKKTQWLEDNDEGLYNKGNQLWCEWFIFVIFCDGGNFFDCNVDNNIVMLIINDSFFLVSVDNFHDHKRMCLDWS